MSLSSIASKLRALRALAESPGATEAERLRAAEKYSELLDKYHLDANELELREEGTEHIVIALGRTGNAFWIGRGFASAIGKFTSCKPWQNERDGAIHFLGLKSDAQFAEWLTRSLVSFVQGQALEFSFEAPPGDLFKSDIEAFTGAAAARIATRLRELCGPRPTSGALVVTRSKMIDEAFNALGFSLRPSRALAINGRSDVIAAGQAAGDRASFARPTSYTQALKITSR